MFLGNPGLSSLIVLANAQNMLMIILYKKYSTIDYFSKRTKLVIGNIEKQLQRKNTHKKPLMIVLSPWMIQIQLESHQI